MATSAGRVRLAGRFPPGTRVRLIKVRDQSVLRAEGGEEVASGTVDKDGVFEHKAEVGARYFLVGRVGGHPLEVRLTGRSADDVASEVAQPPVQPTRTRLADGSWSDEAPEAEKTPPATVAPGPSQAQAGNAVQRSATPHGIATPQDPTEQLPHPRQDSVKKGTVQMSDTPEGIATPLASTPERQDQVPDNVVQRSATPHGVATPIHPGDAVQQQREQDSSLGKAMRGSPGRVAAEPLESKKDVKPDPDESAGSKTKAAGTSVKGADGAEAVKGQRAPAAKTASRKTSTTKRSK